MDRDLLERAARPGRTRGIAVDLWTRARASGPRGGEVLRTGLREARALHSAERRLVQDGLYALIRSERRLAALVGGDPEDLWLGWLVTAGLPPDAAAAQRPGPWEDLVDGLAGVGDGLPVAERLALRHALPESLATRLVVALGPEDAERFLVASDRRAPVDLRANPARCTAGALADALASEGIAATPLGLPGGLRVSGRIHVDGLQVWRDGWFEVQDLGSQRLAALVPAGVRVIDVCAGAGGKALAFAGSGCDVLALDVRPSALDALRRRADRAGVRVRTRAVPVDRFPDGLGTAPWVVVDAPCTGTGTLRRRPELRWGWSEAELARRVAVQRGLLARSTALVADGGRLVYGTCSVLPAENEEIVGSLAGWRVERELRTWPHRDDCDGFAAFVLTAD